MTNNVWAHCKVMCFIFYGSKLNTTINVTAGCYAYVKQTRKKVSQTICMPNLLLFIVNQWILCSWGGWLLSFCSLVFESVTLSLSFLHQELLLSPTNKSISTRPPVLKRHDSCSLYFVYFDKFCMCSTMF